MRRASTATGVSETNTRLVAELASAIVVAERDPPGAEKQARVVLDPLVLGEDGSETV